MKKIISTMAIAAAAALAYAVPASAHVTAQPPEQPSGGYTVVNFRVPNERPEATNKIEVQFPDGIGSASTKPVPGWSAEVKMEKLDTPLDDGHGGKIEEQVGTITWSGGTIEEGQFQEFPVSLKMIDEGELGDKVFFPTLQTYDGGEVVSWTEKPSSADDDSELEKPAPSVTLVESADHHGAMAMDDEKADDAAADSDSGDDEGASASDVSDAEDAARIALGIGILALVIGAFALFRAMRSKR